ncbi:MAG: ATP-binding cassette domain-containing protein [Oscillospiraceae bacterium]|nr:ATP-binding cassette domain-containing protein [Oscillospiraceae bacterium]
MALFVDIEKRLGAFNLKVAFEAENEILALLGASGSGKSMTLKCIAGIENPDKGRIVLDGRTLFDSEKNINLPPQKRKVGYLFQQYALFPNMTVRQNIAVAIKDKANAETIISEALHTMNLEGFENKRPHQLSGGQQQRVALARILVNEPDVLLLDEPFSALDSHLRFRLEQELRRTLRGFDKPIILVSHNRDEVYRMSDKIAVIHDGKIKDTADKKDLFTHPTSLSAAILTGCKNISPIKKLDERRVLAINWGMELALDRDVEDAEFVGIRMHDIRLGEGVNAFKAKLLEEIENPFSYTLILGGEGFEEFESLSCKINKEYWQNIRSEYVDISLPPQSILLLKE